MLAYQARGAKKPIGSYPQKFVRRSPVCGIDARQLALAALLDGHQLHRGDAQLLQVRDLLDQAAIRPGELRARTRIDGVAADVQLVDDRRSPGVAERLIALPVEVSVGDDALGRRVRVVHIGERQVLRGRGRIVAGRAGRVMAGDGRDGGRVRIHHELVRIEAVPLVGRVRSRDAKPVELARGDAGQPHVPDVAGLVAGGIEDDAPRRHGVVGVGEEVEADAGRVPAEDGEVDAVSSRTRSEREGHARADGLHFAQTQQPFQLCQGFGTSRPRTRRVRSCRHRSLLSSV